MALKITTQIGTDLGITSEAYVRIVNYNINKNGVANFALQTFLNQADAAAVSSATPGTPGIARSAQIGDSLFVPLQKEVAQTVTVNKPVQKEIEVQETLNKVDEDGQPYTETVTNIVIQTVIEPVEETVMVTVPDLSVLEDQDIFAFAYGKLKEKLSETFGSENVVDC